MLEEKSFADPAPKSTRTATLYKLGTRAYKDLFEDRNIIFGDFLDQNCEPEEARVREVATSPR